MKNIELEIERIIEEIKTNHAQKVVVQLPDGLKPQAASIADVLETQTGAEIFIWADSNFGACDVAPVEHLKFDLIVNFGHNVIREMKKKKTTSRKKRK